MTNNLISIQGVSKYYQIGTKRFSALEGLTLKIDKNEYVAITGRSGSGKSTLMNILGCLDIPDKGSYELAGKNVSDLNEIELSELRNQTVGFIFQNFNLLPRATVLSNVMQPLAYRIMRNSERKKMALRAIERVGLIDKLTNLPSQLSGGQRQRVAIARALVTRPSIILGDEPTGNLDSKTTKNIMALFDELHREGHTIILVTHEQEIADHCHRVVRLSDGQVTEDSLREAELLYV